MLEPITQKLYGISLQDCTPEQLYDAVLTLCKERQQALPRIQGGRKLYYISAEFLIGKLLSNNLISLGLYEDVKAELAGAGKSLAALEEAEPEPSLGNGGLGRLAACFLDSIATLGLCGDGVGLCYHYGLFHQLLQDNVQQELPNPWIRDDSWLLPTGVHFTVPFGRLQVESTLYDLDVPGWHGGKNKLHLFDLQTKEWTKVHDGIEFDKTDIAHNLTLFLYPDDSDRAGRLLRVYQQYFMVSNAAQFILRELEENGHSVRELSQRVVIQINDTHPSMIIPELIRLLLEKGVSMDEAIELVRHTCAYTNHTILAEALEKWPLDYLEEVVPQLVPIIRELDGRAKAQYPAAEVAIIDGGLVHMARMDIHYGFSVNGVAALHTEILKNSELKPFYDIYPEKFNNKTNGITFRRWLLHADPGLTALLNARIGTGWQTDAGELEQLLAYQDDAATLAALQAVKRQNKEALCAWLQQQYGETLDPESIFDIQIKRLHEYKRQQMNALYIIWKYREIKAGRLPKRPLTLLFGAKAAPAYVLAKDIIHLLLCLSELIAQDPQVSPWLKVVFVENYNVTKAEKLVPAADVSEQISLASKEASGTGNMKLMLNGAVTLGTLDGANVEIAELVGKDNIYLFGAQSGEVIRLYGTGGERLYRARDYYKRPAVEPLVDFILSKELLEIGDPESLARVYKDLARKDWFMTLLDVEDYIQTKERMLADYEDRDAWAKKMLVNIAKAGYFSSDRTIRQYNEDIWHL